MYRILSALLVAPLSFSASAQVVAASNTQAVGQVLAPSKATDSLNNNTIISLVRAGLGPEAIIAKINASTGSYDTSTDALIHLKQAGVFDGVIAAMLTRSTTPVLVNGLADNNSANPLAPHAPGIYLLDDGGVRMHRIDATMANQTKSSNLLGYALTSGLSSMKMKAVIPNPQARVKSSTRRPTFYFYFTQTGPMASLSQFASNFTLMAASPNEFSLVRLDQKKDRREASVGSISMFGGAKSGVSDKARTSFAYEDVAPGVVEWRKPYCPGRRSAEGVTLKTPGATSS
jgi:hypothetical protein